MLFSIECRSALKVIEKGNQQNVSYIFCHETLLRFGSCRQCGTSPVHMHAQLPVSFAPSSGQTWSGSYGMGQNVCPWNKSYSAPSQQLYNEVSTSSSYYGVAKNDFALSLITPSHSSIRYAPLDIKQIPLTKSETDALFCTGCLNPMEISIRLEPCFHLMCFECIPRLQNEWNSKCPVCHVAVDIILAIHPEDDVVVCSGKCHRKTNKIGKAFLNRRSLACHEMLLHEDETIHIGSQSHTIPPPNTESLDHSHSIEQKYRGEEVLPQRLAKTQDSTTLVETRPLGVIQPVCPTISTMTSSEKNFNDTEPHQSATVQTKGLSTIPPSVHPMSETLAAVLRVQPQSDEDAFEDLL